MRIIFLHLPKTAGTTFNSILEQNFTAEHIIEIPFQHYSNFDYMKDKCETVPEGGMIRGHMLFGIHKFVKGNFCYVIFLREPVSRFISQFYYIKRHPTHYLHDPIKDLTIDEFVSSPLSETLFNSQTKMLASSADVTCDKVIYEKALDSLNREDVVAGITEYFDESLLVFQNRIAQIRDITYISKNINPHKKSLLISENTLSRIAEKNKYDILLYERAHLKFNDELTHITGLKSKLRMLRLKNNLKRRGETLKTTLRRIIKS